MDAVAAVKLLQRVSIDDLAGTDGCLCMNCEIQGIAIDVSCRKSSGSIKDVDPNFYGTLIRVHSRHMDSNDKDLQLVAGVVTEQVRELMGDSELPIKVRLCDYETDAEMKCAYCSAPRNDKGGYYCDKHLTEDSRNPWK